MWTIENCTLKEESRFFIDPFFKWFSRSMDVASLITRSSSLHVNSYVKGCNRNFSYVTLSSQRIKIWKHTTNNIVCHVVANIKANKRENKVQLKILPWNCKNSHECHNKKSHLESFTEKVVISIINPLVELWSMNHLLTKILYLEVFLHYKSWIDMRLFRAFVFRKRIRRYIRCFELFRNNCSK